MPRTLLLLALLCSGCESLFTTWDERESFPILAVDGATQPTTPNPLRLRVMTWNIKYGAGRANFWFDMWGDRTEMPLAEVEENMQGLYDLIGEVDPDILVTEEIEINSRRSAYYDMVMGILENTDLQWAAYVPTWQSRYVPTEGLGRVNMGNCIFSKFRIIGNERIAQVDRTDQDFLTASFYLHRAVGRAEIEVGNDLVTVFSAHTEAYDRDRTNHKQQQQILELMREERNPFVMAGDLNALPPGSIKTEKFNDEAPASIGTEFEQPPYDPTDLQPFYDDYLEAIDLARYGTSEAEQSRYYTHSVIGADQMGANNEPGFWNRRLDYMFTAAPQGWTATDVLQQPGDAGIISVPMDLSDHCPVIGTWEIQP